MPRQTALSCRTHRQDAKRIGDASRAKGTGVETIACAIPDHELLRPALRAQHELSSLAPGACPSPSGPMADGVPGSCGQAFVVPGPGAGSGRLIRPESSLSTVVATAASSPGR